MTNETRKNGLPQFILLVPVAMLYLPFVIAGPAIAGIPGLVACGLALGSFEFLTGVTLVVHVYRQPAKMRNSTRALLSFSILFLIAAPLSLSLCLLTLLGDRYIWFGMVGLAGYLACKSIGYVFALRETKRAKHLALAARDASES
jgi:hypothetical protein